MQRRVNVRGVIINDRGELFCQRLTAREQDGRDFWCTPGGRLELGESLVDGLRREMVEETGVVPEIGRLLFVQQFAESGDRPAHGPSEYLELFFHITNWQDYQRIDLAATTHGLVEVAACDFVDPRAVTILPTYFMEVDLGRLVSAVHPVELRSEL